MTEGHKEPPTLHKTETEQTFFAQVQDEGTVPVAGSALAVEPEELWENRVDVVIPPVWQPIAPLFLALASFFLLWFFLDDFRFSLLSAQPVDLGSLSDGCSGELVKKLKHNQLVTFRGIIPQPGLTAEARVHFSKRYYVAVLGCDMLLSLEEKRYRELLGASRRRSTPIQEITLPQAVQEKIGMSKIRIQAPDSMSNTNFVAVGRAILATQSTTADNLRRFYAGTQSMPFSANTYIVADGELPHRVWWVWVGYIILSAFLSYNLWRFLRVARREWRISRS